MRIGTLFLILWTLLAGQAMADSPKTVFGYIEKATLTQQDLTLSAKLDTGAKTASLNAIKITEIEKNGKAYLNFIVPSKEGDIAFQCEYVGKVQIKMRTGENQSMENQIHSLLRKSVKRPVVLMTIRLNNTEKTIRVNLTNRKHFIYPLLLGREAINAFDGIVDPSKKFTTIESHPTTEKAASS